MRIISERHSNHKRVALKEDRPRWASINPCGTAARPNHAPQPRRFIAPRILMPCRQSYRPSSNPSFTLDSPQPAANFKQFRSTEPGHFVNRIDDRRTGVAQRDSNNDYGRLDEIDNKLIGCRELTLVLYIYLLQRRFLFVHLLWGI